MNTTEFAEKAPTINLSSMSNTEPWYQKYLDEDIAPDWLIRMAIRRLIKSRLKEESQGGPAQQETRRSELIRLLNNSPIAIATNAANSQHYQVPTRFFELILGCHMKYSCSYWPQGVNNLDESELAMLELTCARAGIENGQRILDLGCGWGSLSLYLVERYPQSRITAVSNSRTQKEFIDAQVKTRELANIEVVMADMNDFEAKGKFDRIVSIEMFEHMRNYRALLARIASWMAPEAHLFIHIFSHRRFAYLFEDRGPNDWMARNFFTGGVMPSDDLLLEFQHDVQLEKHWRIDGTHYQKTSEAWLEKMNQNRAEIMQIFAEAYGEKLAVKNWVQWRIFFMACSELFGYRRGQEWLVSHYLFSGT